MESPENRLHRCAINPATLGHREPLDVTLDRTARASFGGVAPWRHEVEAIGASAVARRLRALQLTVTGYCRLTYLTGATKEARRASIDSDIRALHDAAELDARCFVLVVGGVSAGSCDLAGARRQVEVGVAQLLETARKLRIPLAIEPLHPMYAACRSVVNTRSGASAVRGARIRRSVDARYRHRYLSLLVGPPLSVAIAAAGRARRILAYHVSDWLADTQDMLMDRGMIGDGVVDLMCFRREAEHAGYEGMVEVELFSRFRWRKVQPDDLLSVCAHRLQTVC